MGEDQNSETVQFDRTVEQAILALKKGAHLLKCRSKGRPKFCPFKLSMENLVPEKMQEHLDEMAEDEKYLIWYSGQEERQMRLSSVMKIVRGQRTANFQRQLQPDRLEQSFSLIYANGERTLDLICKDKAQADSWFMGLRAVITKQQTYRISGNFRSSSRGVQSCINSPASFIRRKQNLGLLEETTEFSKIRSLCGSPSLEERCLSDGLSCSSDSFYSVESSLSRTYVASDALVLASPYPETEYNLNNWKSDHNALEFPKHSSQRFLASPPIISTPHTAKDNILKDIMIWGATGGFIDGTMNQDDTLSPKLLESTTMFDVQSISLGVKHAALVTRQGEVFCWGDGNQGKLGLKANIDMNHPKRVDSLDNVAVWSVSCGEYQTCAVSESGELYTWGADGYAFEERGSNFLPRNISDTFGCSLSVSRVACGGWHTAIVTSSGQLFTYGDGTFGVLGHGNLESVSRPKEVESLSRMKVIYVSCGPWHTAAIVETIMEDRYHKYYYARGSGKLFTWGDGDKGRLGHIDGNKKLVPTCVYKLVDYDFVQVSCGWTLTVALTVSGMVYTMGSAVHGQLGCPKAKDNSINVVEGNLKGQFVKEISSGSHHVAVLTKSGNVYTWGKGGNGQLGLGDTTDRNFPSVVEPLRDRLVESVACGSNLTAAICLHKEISLSDQSSCSACKLAFGFTRKKHNCYNCGLLFCNSCSSKKAVNASLAPNRSKLSRVCDQCYDHIWRTTDYYTTRQMKLESCSPRMLPTPRRVSDDWREKEMGLNLKSDIQTNENSVMENHGDKLKFSEAMQQLSCDGQPPRWGQVSGPSMFNFDNMSLSFTSSSRNLSVSSKPTPSVKGSRVMDCSNESNRMLTEEVGRLRAEVSNLERQCELRNQKIKECQQQLDETWLLAKEEAQKSKAAKDVIKALEMRLHTMKEKQLSNTKEVKASVLCSPSQVSPAFDDTESIPYLTPITTRLRSETQSSSLREKRIEDDDLCDSFPGKRAGHNSHSQTRLFVDASPILRTEIQQNACQDSKSEWVEQHEPGVYITFTVSPSGQRTLKRVRFSRKRFTEKDAQRWWEENQVLVYNKYGTEAYNNSDRN